MIEPENDAELEPEVAQGLQWFFDQIPFNKMLGMQMTKMTKKRIEVSIEMKPELIGNFLHGILHGGVISSLLDVAGGAIAVIGAHERIKHLDSEERAKVLSKIGTIDLRVDYLRPGKGAKFVAAARLLRTGNKVAVTRMELHNDEGELLALGTGTYLCG